MVRGEAKIFKKMFKTTFHSSSNIDQLFDEGAGPALQDLHCRCFLTYFDLPNNDIVTLFSFNVM